MSSFVRLRGLPFQSTEQDVAQWFACTPGGPISITRVLFTYNNAGRKSGEAFVELPEFLAERAVQLLHNRNMQNRYIEVFVSSEAEANQANIAPPMQLPGMQMAGLNVAATGSLPAWAEAGNLTGLVRLRGLPFNATPEQVLQFFAGFEPPRGTGGVHMVLGANGRPNGEAFVEFGSEELAEAAMSKDRQTMGTRYVEVFRSTADQMAAALHRASKSNNIAPGMGGGMAGLGGMGAPVPYGFGPFSMPHPMPHAYGQPPGGVMGGGMGGAPGAEAVVKMRGLPYKVKVPDVLDFFSGISVPLHGVHLMFNEREQPTGEAFVEFASSDDRERAMTKDRHHMGGRYVELFRVNRGEMLQALEQFVGGYMNNNHMPQMISMGGAMGGAYSPYGGAMAGPMGCYGAPAACGGPGAYGSMQQPVYPPAPGGGGGGGGGGAPPHKPGTLRMRGLPFRATTDDIYRFFLGLQISSNNGIVLGQRDGRATGEAWVTFTSPAEAQRAMSKNNTHLGSRYIELFAT